MSAICQVFDCPPSVALEQDHMMVKRVLEWRMATRAIELFNAGEDGKRELASNPGLLRVLNLMRDAQAGTGD